MSEQKYRLYAAYLKNLQADSLKGIDYSFQDNNKYILVFTDKSLKEPFRQIPESTKLTDEEKAWKDECERKNLLKKVETNVAYMKENEEEYAETLNQFFDRLEEELEKEQGGNNDSTADNKTEK